MKAGDKFAWGEDDATEGEQQQEGELMWIRSTPREAPPRVAQVTHGHVEFPMLASSPVAVAPLPTPFTLETAVETRWIGQPSAAESD